MFEKIKGFASLVIFHEFLDKEDDIIDEHYNHNMIPIGGPQPITPEREEWVRQIEEQTKKPVSHFRHLIKLENYGEA